MESFSGARNGICVCEEYNSDKVYILYPEDVSSLSVYLVVCIFPYLSFYQCTLEPQVGLTLRMGGVGSDVT